VRVVAGSARGRRLRTPAGTDTRPTTDRVREAVFNALFARGGVAGARVADLFAGSGALGIEALSRGADHCWFVESARDAVAVIGDNVADLGFRDRTTVLAGELDRLVDRLPDDLDVVFADPPYRFDAWDDLLTRLLPHLGDEGFVVAESDRSLKAPAGWENLWERSYGGTVITFVAPAAGTGVDA
jgi:16S rRNA (guanine966-N2)-methyltransferase